MTGVVTINGTAHLVRLFDDIAGTVTTWCDLVTDDTEAVHRPGPECPCHECVIALNDDRRRQQLVPS